MILTKEPRVARVSTYVARSLWKHWSFVVYSHNTVISETCSFELYRKMYLSAVYCRFTWWFSGTWYHDIGVSIIIEYRLICSCRAV